uniref:Ribonuclease HII n=1 Tax=viral metagenome TaxID=1070528 RepID=A0A6C0D7C1_9ZZZZ
MPKKPVVNNLHILYDSGNRYEIGIDEAGRGPLFGRLYVAACVLPKESDSGFHHEWMCDSKKIHSRKKMQELSQYIKTHALAWHIHYVEADVIDTINIRQAVLMAMHECAKQVILQLSSRVDSGETPIDPATPYMREYMLFVDGNDFTPHMIFNEATQTMEEIPFETIEGGDNKYTFIAAASILAKNERDTYIEDLCNRYSWLNERYGLAKNMGYGTQMHRDGIQKWGITQWHRKSYGICKTAPMSAIIEEAP